MGNVGSERAEVTPPAPLTSIVFVLNGKHVEIKGASTLLSLNEWLRVQPGFTGTKKMCSEGGCGCCVVAVSTASLVEVHNGTKWEVLSDSSSTIAINSCLCPLYAVSGWSVTTVEGIGNSTDGFHEIQRRLVDYNGSQCGYCTPGFVMSMYSLLQTNPNPSPQEVEDIFDGNICRCTGYRPILAAMKSFSLAKNSNISTDIEDIADNICPKTNQLCSGEHAVCWGVRTLASDPLWYAPSTLAELSSLIEANSGKTFRLIAGDTGRGVYKDVPQVDVHISLSHITELHNVKINDSSLTVGAGITLTKLIDLLNSNSVKPSSYLDMAKHISKVANTPVRNVATWAGNVVLACQHQDFPSDIFLLLAASQAFLTIASLMDFSTVNCSVWDLLSKDMSKYIILSVEIPFTSTSTKFTSYKIMPRGENSKAEVNAAFSMELDSTRNFTVKTTPVLVVGGGESRPFLCSKTASFFTGKNLSDPSTLKGAMESLSGELNNVDNVKKGVAQGLLYKFYLACIPGLISAEVQSASSMLSRPLSSGSQIYQTNTSRAPVGLPIRKLEGLVQASGEAQYTTDIPILPNEVAAAFVLATKCNVNILNIDTSAAEKMPGFIRVITPKDIPSGGTNNFVDHSAQEPEVIFADYRSEYVGQAVALVLAETPKEAEEIAKVVSVQYGEPTGPPIISTKDAVEKESFFENIEFDASVGDAKSAIANSDFSVKGQIDCGGQYHFTMETQNALVVPHEDGYTVYSSTQWVTHVQQAVANVLGISNSSVDVIIKRVGGGYGGKITRPSLVAAACALGACVTRRPVRLQLDLEMNMKLIGKRFPYLASYEVGFSKEGIVNGIAIDIFSNCGINCSDEVGRAFPNYIDNAYFVPNWEIHIKLCRSNMATNVACRAPCALQAIFMMESVMDHAARGLGMDPDVFRKMNLYKDGQVKQHFKRG